MALTIIVAANNMVVNLMLKLFGERRKAVILCGVALSFAGVLLGKYVFAASAGVVCFMIAAVMIAFPAGFFPMFSTVAKELNPERYTAMSVAFLNFMAFVFISSYQNIVGFILKSYPPQPGSLAFPIEAYSAVFNFFILGAIISTIAALLVPETRDRVVQ